MCKGLKSTITKLRNISNGLNSKSETAEKRVNELKNKPREREGKKWGQQNLRDLWKSIKSSKKTYVTDKE